ncbi:hypothetical protein LTR38_018275, partial [Friedmanniomyces endolithicus]
VHWLPGRWSWTATTSDWIPSTAATAAAIPATAAVSATTANWVPAAAATAIAGSADRLSYESATTATAAAAAATQYRTTARTAAPPADDQLRHRQLLSRRICTRSTRSPIAVFQATRHSKHPPLVHHRPRSGQVRATIQERDQWRAGSQRRQGQRSVNA